VVGDVEGRNCLITDDMVDTAGTMASAVHALRTGVPRPYTPVRRMPSSPGRRGAAGSAPGGAGGDEHDPDSRGAGVRRAEGAVRGGLLARAIEYIHSNDSVSQLFEIAIPSRLDS
jgi:ribose-phosphate pyrophosphokinase